jgi:hypothetical protein
MNRRRTFLLSQSTLPNTALVTTGHDWTLHFLEELHTWLAWVEHLVHRDGTRARVILEVHYKCGMLM